VNAIDTNILVYAHRADNPWHAKAKKFLEVSLQGDRAIAVPYHCLVEFFGIVTNPRIFKNPTTTEDALRQCANLLEAPALTVLTEAADSFDGLSAILSQSRVIGAAVHDARVASVCIENGVKVIYTMDRDFSRFSQLKSENPLL
jgi:toxin-antitoxin system PIN domain toxin